MTAPGGHASRRWGALLAALREYGGAKLYSSLLLIIFAAFAEGFGLILLLPMAEIIFSSGSSNLSSISARVDDILTQYISADLKIRMLALSAIFMLLMLLRAALLLKRDKELMALSQGFVDHVRAKLMTALALADWPIIKSLRRAHMLDSLTTNIGRISVAMRFLSQSIIALTLVAAYIVTAFTISPAIGLLLLVTAFSAISIAAIWIGKSQSLGASMTIGNRNVAQETTRFLDGLKAAKACQAEADFIRQFKQAVGKTRSISVTFAMQQGRLRRSVELLGALFGLLLLFIGYWIIKLSPAELLIAGAILIRLVPTLLGSLTGVQSLAFAMSAFSATEELRLQAEANRNMAMPNISSGNEENKNFSGPITLCNIKISAEYNPDSPLLLAADNLTLAQTGITCISGPSGAGKSTLAEAVAGLTLPKQGEIKAPNIILDESSRRQWQQLISFAPQEPFIFSGTVIENLCWPNIMADKASIWAALEHACADHIVRALPGGLDHPLLDGGARLSGGERQRICLARAFLRPSSLLILDETFSSVDAQLEQKIMHSLNHIARQKAVLLVSHSQAVADAADHIINVTAGKAFMKSKPA